MTSERLDRRAAADRWHENVQVGRAEIFGPHEPRMLPIAEPEDAKVMFPGYVGLDYEPGGVVLVAINPAGGTDRFRATPGDRVLIPQLRRLRDARTDTDRLKAFEEANRLFLQVVPEWNIWTNVALPVLRTLKVEPSRVAYLNLVPYRTRKNTMPPAEARTRAWTRVTKPTLDLLAPGRIVTLGKKVDGPFSRLYAGTADRICIPRMNGDWGLPPEARDVLRNLASR